MNNNFLEIYIHIPFCEKKCSYCDFVSFNTTLDNIDKYINQLILEIESKSIQFADKTIKTIYIGGGTPSYISEIYIVNILSTIYKYYKIANNCEISIELNPHSSIKNKLIEYKKIGINRLSFGVQSTNDNELKLLGRIHSYNDFLKSYNDSLDVGFNNINVDLIKYIPEQTEKSFYNTLNDILKLNITHISIYDLIIEPKTVFFILNKKNKLNLPDENEKNKIDNLMFNMLQNYNFKQYEISNFCKNNKICKHNFGYWNDESYIGFGLNSSSYIDNIRYKNISNFNKYLQLDFNNINNKNNQNDYYDEIDFLDENELMSEFVFLGLRKNIGINNNDFYKKFKKNFYDIFKAQINKYLNLGLLIENNNNYYLSKRGFDISNIILSDFLL